MNIIDYVGMKGTYDSSELTVNLLVDDSEVRQLVLTINVLSQLEGLKDDNLVVNLPNFSKLESKNKELESENKSLRCCGNCRYWADSVQTGWKCTNAKKDTSGWDFRTSKCDKWESVFNLVKRG